MSSDNGTPIGQHFVRGRASAPNSGQRTKLTTGVNVGQPSGGELNNGAAPASRPGADVSTQTGVARNANDGAIRHPAK
jgi:hypothetical protein